MTFSIRNLLFESIRTSSATVGNGNTSLLLGNSNLGAGNNWASEGGTKEVDILVDGVALDGREAKLIDEFTAEILNVASGSTDLEGLSLSSLEVL